MLVNNKIILDSKHIIIKYCQNINFENQFAS